MTQFKKIPLSEIKGYLYPKDVDIDTTWDELLPSCQLIIVKQLLQELEEIINEKRTYNDTD